MNQHPLPAGIVRIAAALLVTISSAGAASAATVSWAVDADGDWNNPANWSGAAVPTLSDTVIIDRPSGLYTITVPSGTHAAYSIHSNERLVLDAGTLTVAETLQVNSDLVLDGTTLVGAIVSPGANGEGMDAPGGTLDGVTMNADLDLSGATGRTVNLSNGLTLNGTCLMGASGSFGRFIVNGTQTIDGTGEMVLGNSSGSSGIVVGSGSTLTIESGIEIHGGRGTIGTNGANRGLVLRGPVTAEVSGLSIEVAGDSLLIEAPVTAVNGGSIGLNGTYAVRANVSVTGGGELELNGAWVNEDLVEANPGCTLDLNGTWTNLGMIRPDSATVTLGGNFAWADVGDFVRVGGTVTLDGTLDNTANALTLDANTGTWVLTGTVIGGSVETGLAGSELRYGANSTLNGVTMNADMNLSEATGITVNLSNGLTLNATATMGGGGSFGRFITNGTQTIDGTGEMVLGNSSGSSGIVVGSGSTLTIESGIEIHGGRGTIGTNGANRRLLLRGPVTAEVSGQTIEVAGDSLLIEAPVTAVNGGGIGLNGTYAVRANVSVTGGGELELNGAWVNEDLVEANPGCTLDLNGTWTNLGMIRPDSATVTLGGNFAWADVGDFVRVGGTVTLDGTLDNTANALTLDANTGTWLLTGTVIGGSVETGLAGSELRYGANSTLNGVTMNADMNLSEATGITVNLSNGLTLNATALMGGSGSFGRFITNGTQTIDGTGEIVLGNSSASSGIVVGSGSTLTIESGIEIHGGRGAIGTNGANRRLLLRGPVTAEVSGQTIEVAGDSLLIEAPVTAVNGGGIGLNGTYAVRANVSVTGGGELELNGNWANEDLVEANPGCTLDLNGTWTNLGMIRPDSATVTLGGNFAWADVGDFVRVGGTVTLDGTLDNTANALTLDANTGTWLLTGTILSGSVETGLAGSELRYGSNSTLNGVVMNADMDLSEATGITVNLSNGLTLNATALMGASGSFGRFIVNGTQTIDGTGEMVLGNSSVSSGIVVSSVTTLTIESGIEIHGGRGTIGTNSTNRTVTNRGTVRADSAGISLTITASSWTNEGSIIAARGTIDNDGPVVNTGLVQVDSAATWTGSGSLTQDAGATVIAAGGTFARPFTMNGGTLSGGGVITGDVTATGGTIAPGASPGLLTGSTTLSQTDGALAVEIAGSDPASYDRLSFGTSAALAGSLGVGFLDSFLPAIGDTFTIVSAPTVTGQYAPVMLPSMIPSQRWLVEPAADAYRLIVEFNPPPTAMCNDTTLVSGLDCEADVAAADIDDGTTEPNGDPFTMVLDPPGPYAIGVHLVNFIATDSLGAADTCLTTITVTNSAPVAAAHDTTLISNASCEADVAAADLDDGTADPEGQSVSLALVPAGPYPIGANPVLFIATDACGAADTTQITITVTNLPPVAAASDTTLMSGPECVAAIAAAALDAGTTDPEGQSFGLALEPAGPYALGATPVLFIATDACGAADTVQITITVVNPAPVAAGRDTTLIGEPPAWTADVDPAALDDGSSDPAGQTLFFSLSPAGPYALGEHVVQFIAADSCGASDTTMVTISVINNPPMAAGHDTTLVANLSCEGEVVAAALDDGSTDPEGQPLTFELAPPGPYAIGVHVVEFIANDDCGASDTTTVTITVINNAPVASAIDTTIVGQPPSWTANVTAADVDSFTVDPDGHAFTLALEPPGPYGLGSHPVLFIATDDCGAADTTQITIAVINNPPIAMARDTTLIVVIDSCKVGMLADSLDTGSYDPEGGPVTLALVPAPPYDIGVHPVDFIVTDDCGATDTTQITITVFNNIPVAMAVTQLVLEGDSLTCGAAADPSEFDDGSSDADGHSLFFSAEPPSPYPYGSTQVMFIVSDGCQSDTTMTEVLVECALASNDPGPAPLRFAVTPAAPNPFQRTTRIRLSLPEARDVRALVFDIAGRRVADLVDRTMSPGEWDIAWDGRRADGTLAEPGVYLVRVRAGSDLVVRRAIRVR